MGAQVGSRADTVRYCKSVRYGLCSVVLFCSEDRTVGISEGLLVVWREEAQAGASIADMGRNSRSSAKRGRFGGSRKSNKKTKASVIAKKKRSKDIDQVHDDLKTPQKFE